MKLKLLIFSLTFTLLFFSCGSSHSNIKAYLKNSDSVSIAFFSDPDSNRKITIRDRASIKKLGDCIDGEAISPVKCSENGSIWFYEGGKRKLQVDFSLNSECSYFSYMMNDKIYTKKMDSDDSQYLEGIKAIASNSL